MEIILEPFVAGTRVRISAAHHWAKSALGTVGEPPAHVRQLAGGWRGNVREVQAIKGRLLFQWVQFDEPQRDADGDGPYDGAEIQLAYLERAV